MLKSPYDCVAHEYYDNRHVTSRNFDQATKAGLAAGPFQPPQGLILELGAGRGRASEFIGVPAEQLVQLDSSEEMFRLDIRERCMLRVHASACSIPLVSQQFSAVVGFLVDPFLGLECLSEAYRMLVQGGTLLFTTPTKEWGVPLRSSLNIDTSTTRFRIFSTNETVLLPSYLYSREQMTEMLKHVGFQNVCITEHCVPRDVDVISPDVLSVCTRVGIGAFEFPIVHLVWAQR